MPGLCCRSGGGGWAGNRGARTGPFHGADEEEAADVETYTTLFRRLNMAAANVSKSRALIHDALKEME